MNGVTCLGGLTVHFLIYVGILSLHHLSYYVASIYYLNIMTLIH